MYSVTIECWQELSQVFRGSRMFRGGRSNVNECALQSESVQLNRAAITHSVSIGIVDLRWLLELEEAPLSDSY